MTTFGVTGATGYVGSAITGIARQNNHQVVALGRRPVDGLAWRPYELGELPRADLFREVEVVVHCAYDLALTRKHEIWRVNVEGTQRLVEAATAAGVRFVLISSMSAYPGTTQIYGRAKLATERFVLAAGGCVIRLGLVYGDDGGGMIGSLERIVQLPITPVIGRDAHQFTVHVGDMASGVVRVALGADIGPDPVGLAHPVPVRFEDLLLALAARAGTRLRPVHVPWVAAYRAMRACERLRVPLPLRADSILGLVRPAPAVPGAERWDLLGVQVRRFEEWAASGNGLLPVAGH